MSSQDDTCFHIILNCIFVFLFLDQIYFMDNIGLTYLLKGMCLKYLNCPLPAIECFRKVISSEKELSVDHYLVPYATYEVGIILWADGKKDEALITLENAK